MQASEKLNRIKNETEISSRLDDIVKQIKALKKDIDDVKKELKDGTMTTNKQITELYACFKKMDEAYCSGLSSSYNIDISNQIIGTNLSSSTTSTTDIFPFKN